uniref:NS1 protein n=1 Tax=Mops bat parvovirus TaxID=3141925 RepID=A0AAU7E1A2_9VIRU
MSCSKHVGSNKGNKVLFCTETITSECGEGAIDKAIAINTQNEMERKSESIQGAGNLQFPIFHEKRDTVNCLREIEQSFRSGKNFTGDYRGGVNGIFRAKANLCDPLRFLILDDEWQIRSLVTDCVDELPSLTENDYASTLGYYQTYNSLGIVIRTLPCETIYTIDIIEKLCSIEDPFILICECSKEGVWHWHMIWFTSRRCDNAKRTLLTLLAPLNISISTQQTKSFKHLLKYILKEPRVIYTHKHDDLHRLVGSVLNRHENTVVEQKETFPNDMIKDIIGAMKEHNKYTFEELLNFAPEVMSKYLHKPNIESIIQNCKLYLLRPTDITVTYERILHGFEPVFDFFTMYMFLDFQGIDAVEFMFDLWSVLFQTRDKINTFVIQGPSNTGKTTFIREMLQLFNWGEIQSSGQFMFQNCINKELLIWEEPLIGSDFAETCKRVFEGMNTQVSVKYKAPQTLYRTPIIITTNKDLWHYTTADESAFRNRICLYLFNRNASLFDYEWIGTNYSRLRREYRECFDIFGTIVTSSEQIRGSCGELSETADSGITSSDGSDFDCGCRSIEEHRFRPGEYLGTCQELLKRWDYDGRSSSSKREDSYGTDTPRFTSDDCTSTDDDGSRPGSASGNTSRRRSSPTSRHNADRGHKRRRTTIRGGGVNGHRGNRSAEVVNANKENIKELYCRQFGYCQAEEVPKNTVRCPKLYVDWETRVVEGGYGRFIKKVNWETFLWVGWVIYNALG